MSLLLLFRSPRGTPYGSYWGPHFPRKSRGHASYWDRHFPDQPSDDVPGVSPAGVAALILAENVTVTYSWRTGLFKSYSGLERRSNHVDDPPQLYEGDVLLDDTQTRAQRARLARFAALGRPFQLGLPYEQLTLRAGASGTVIPVFSTALSDWCIPGQRVVVLHRTLGTVEAVIQSSSSTSITLDVAPGAVGSRGAVIMPMMAVFLDPQQVFARYPTALERWQIKARNVNAGFVSSAVAATLELADVTGSGALDGLRFVARTAGAAGNSITITQSDDALTSGGEISEVGDAITIKYMGGTTTVDQYTQLVSTSALVRLSGSASSLTAVLAATDDEFTEGLTGGADATAAEVGVGATVTEFAGRPVWDRGIDVEGTASDSIQSMAEVQDLGGLPFASQSAAVPDWGRALKYSALIGAEWQWIKRFLDEVRGRWRTFWLASWRPDLVPVSVSTGTLTINDDDFAAFWPLQWQYVQCVVAGEPVYARISSSVDNGDGTLTLSIVDEDDVALTLASTPTLVSWLDRVRFERDDIPLGFQGFTWTLSETVRVVQQPTAVAASDFDSAEDSVEESQPREGAELILPVVTYRIATGTRDITINGATFTAGPVGRDEIKIATIDDTGDVIVQLPVSHPAIARYLQGGIPPRQILVNIWRRHASVDAEETVWRGVVSSVAVDGHVAKLRLVPRSLLAMQRRIPTVTASRTCPHILYGANTCRVPRADFLVSATVTSYNGRIVTISTIGGNPSGWADGGEIVHVASGERMTVQSQVSTVVTCQAQIQELQIGDAVELYAGCAHNVDDCRDKFDNMDNYGGFPQLKTTRVFMQGKGFTIKVLP